MWEEQVFNLLQCKFKVVVLSGAVLSCVVLCWFVVVCCGLFVLCSVVWCVVTLCGAVLCGVVGCAFCAMWF